MATYNPTTGEILPRTYKTAGGKYLQVYHEGRRVQAGRFAWEQAVGPVPRFHRVRFKDGNATNLKLDNLYLEAPMTPELSHEWLVNNYTYDPDMGWFISHRTGRPMREELTEGGYPRIHIRGKYYRASRLVWFYTTGEWPQGAVDHINDDKMDYRWENLQELTDQQNNMRKRKVHKPRKTESGKWQASTDVFGKDLYLGIYDTENEAIAAHAGARQLLRLLVDGGLLG